ncbi:hypothetical protein AAOE16_03920 [Ekhidna sp. MALMAid0563]|uniref:hypothetical protein n=1 Tax=Ekhidna sp. MALMAid0563 TaxID=3143937 RepID=UPI0032DF8788
MKNQYLISCLLLLLISCDNAKSTLNDFDGNQYKTQKYGNTIWMTENLRTTRDKHGNEVMYYFPNEDPTKSEDFGLLYDFETHAGFVLTDGSFHRMKIGKRCLI